MPFEAWRRLAEERIDKAMKEGAFDGLPGSGRPLLLEDDTMVPEDLRMAYKVLKNSGHLPPELEEARDIHNARDLLAACEDEEERYRQMQKLNLLITQANERRVRYGGRAIALQEDQYYDKVVARVAMKRR